MESDLSICNPCPFVYGNLYIVCVCSEEIEVFEFSLTALTIHELNSV